MNQELHERLVDLARNEGLTTYSRMSAHFGLDMRNDVQNNQFTNMLVEIARHEQGLNHPMLTSLVVHEGYDNNPGEGFFALAREFGLFNGSRDNIDRLTFWSSQVRSVYNHWRNR